MLYILCGIGRGVALGGGTWCAARRAAEQADGTWRCAVDDSCNIAASMNFVMENLCKFVGCGPYCLKIPQIYAIAARTRNLSLNFYAE